MKVCSINQLGGITDKDSKDWSRENVEAIELVSISEHVSMDFFPCFGVMDPLPN